MTRVLLYYDMEGLSGQDDPRTFQFRYPEQYALGQDLLVGDVNAVVDGLFAGGATEVHVVDGHASGNPEPDVPPSRLDPRAVQVLRYEPFDAYTGLVVDDAYEAVALVGMHAKTGSAGFAAHTWAFGIEIELGGRPITETELIAYSWGRVGVPVVFASGDDTLRDQLGAMSWLEYAVVKESTGPESARLRPLEEARRQLRERARSAIERLPEMDVMRLPEPASGVPAAVRAVPPADLSILDGVPGIDYHDGRVTFTAPDFQAAFDGIVALARVAEQAGKAGVAAPSRAVNRGRGFHGYR